MINVRGDIHVGYLGLIRSILEKIGSEHRPAVMRMIDKKEREALKEYLADIGADHLGLMELIDLKGMGALDRAVEISRDLERVEVQEASSTGKEAAAEEISSKEGRTSSRTGRKVGVELKLDEFQEMIGLLEAYGVSATIDFEIVRGLATSDETFAAVEALAKKLGKVPVEVNDFPGFVSNRVLMPMINEAVFCLMEGVASAESIDTVMKLGMNHPLGPLALADLIGLDTCLSILEVLHEGLGDDKYRPCPLLKRMVAAGHLGRKTGRGFHIYDK